MPRSIGLQAVAALRVAVGTALDALSPAVPLVLDNYQTDTAALTWWVEESVIGGPSLSAEIAAPSPTALREFEGAVQYLVRGPADVGYFAVRTVADAIEAAAVGALLVLDDNATPVRIGEVVIGALRGTETLGRVSMPVVIAYDCTA